LKHQVFCDGFRFGDVDAFERCFVDDDATFFGVLLGLPTFFLETLCDLLTAAWVEGCDDGWEGFSGFFMSYSTLNSGRKN
jgi:hypothetical protein